jgi:co-chaperonin GroES (HSP10)
MGSSADAAKKTDAKRIRKVNPLGMRVLVEIRKEANVTDAGLYLPEGAKQALHESLLAEVIEVASAMDQDTEEETNVSGIPQGSMVLIPKSAGVKVPWDENLRIVETKDILAIVNEISIV